jgi:environmental stress-induced protein Ves
VSGPTVIRAAEARRMAWKNGGGETLELLTSPFGAGLDTFDWRISLATVTADGPFSIFPEIDRTLTLLDGAGLDLTIGDAAPVRLTGDTEPFAFAADVPCRGRLLAGPVTDLNVMTRRGRFSHVVTRERLGGRRRVAPGGIATVLICLGREMRLDGGLILGRGDAAVLAGGAVPDLAPGDDQPAALVIAIEASRESV